jgi:hypothetical protein
LPQRFLKPSELVLAWLCLCSFIFFAALPFICFVGAAFLFRSTITAAIAATAILATMVFVPEVMEAQATKQHPRQNR